jgi:hypothetical protein
LAEGLNSSSPWSNIYKDFQKWKFIQKIQRITNTLNLWTKVLRTDPQRRDPKDAFTLLKDILNYAGKMVKFMGFDKVLKQAVDTVQTAPGGVPAAERQRDSGTINVHAVRGISELEKDPSFGCLYRCP